MRYQNHQKYDSWGKEGGSAISPQSAKTAKKTFCLLTLLFFILSICFSPAVFAGRNGFRGAGRTAHFKLGTWAANIGIGLGSMAVGGILSSEINGILSGDVTRGVSAVQQTVSALPSLSDAATNFATFTAVSQVGRAVGNIGQYCGWAPGITRAVSAAATGTAGGFVNPGPMLGDALSKNDFITIGSKVILKPSLSTSLKGAVVGGITGTAQGFAEYAVDGNKPAPSIAGQIAGMTAGVMAGNFSRSLVNTNTYHLRPIGYFMKEEPANSNPPEKGPAQKPFPQKQPKQLPQKVVRVTEVSLTGKPTTAPVGPKELTNINNRLKSGRYKITDLSSAGGNTVVQISTTKPGFRGVLANIAEGTFIKTADMWPVLATRSLSIVATHTLAGKNRWLAPLISEAVEGATMPFLSNLQYYGGLTPSLYTGANRIGSRLNYANSFSRQISGSLLNKVQPEIYKLAKQYKGNPEGYRTAAVKLLKEKYGFTEAESKRTNELLSMSGEEFAGKFHVRRNAVQRLNLNSTRGLFFRTGIILPTILKQRFANYQKQDVSLGEIAGKFGTSPSQMFWSASLRDMKYGMIEGVISGGASALGSKVAKHNPVAAIGIGYGTAMLTGLARGIIWYKTWEPAVDKNGNMLWSTQYTYAKPQRNEAKNSNDVFDIKIAEFQNRRLPRMKENWKRFGYLTGLPSRNNKIGMEKKPSLRPLPSALREFDKNINKYISNIYRGNLNSPLPSIFEVSLNNKEKVPYLSSGEYTLKFSNTPPSLKESILVSLAQANKEYFTRAYSFGAPLGVDPRQVSTITMTDYVSSLNNMGIAANLPNGMANYMQSSIVSSTRGATGDIFLTALSAIPQAADFLGMQRSRLVKTNAPKSPYVMQLRDNMPWALGFQTRFILPFPSDIYRPRSATGKSFLRDTR